MKETLGLLVTLFAVSTVFAQSPQTLSYQSYMTDAEGAPVDTTVRLQFALFDVGEGGEALWSEIQEAVPVSGGVLSTRIGQVEDLSDVAFDRPLWLQVTFCLFAGRNCTGDAGKTGVDGSRIPLDAVPFALGVRGLRYIPAESPNLIGGYDGNSVADGAIAATISGGGGEQLENRVEAVAAGQTIGGGLANTVSGKVATVSGGGANHASAGEATVGGGVGNNATGTSSTIAGGRLNRADGSKSTVGGGNENEATVLEATVGGGSSNNARGIQSTVSGGAANLAEGPGSVIPGGYENQAIGLVSFASGFRSVATHDGTFVWSSYASDNQDEFTSTGRRQFLISAPNGVGIGTNSPKGGLHVNSRDNQFPDLVLGGTSSGEVDGLLTSDPGFTNSNIVVRANGDVSFRLDADDNDANKTFSIEDGDGTDVFVVDEAGTTFVNALDSDGNVSGSTLTTNTSLGEGNKFTPGTVYLDNILYAWADVEADGTVTSYFGCSVNKLETGLYQVTTSKTLPNGISVTVTPKTIAGPAIASASPGSKGTDVKILTWDGAKFVAVDAGFYIQIVGRP